MTRFIVHAFLLFLIEFTISSWGMDEVRWIPALKFDPSRLDPWGMADMGAGQEFLLYPARVKHEDGILPGQYSPGIKRMSTVFRGKVVQLAQEKTELLQAPLGWITWIPLKSTKDRNLNYMIGAGVMPRTGEVLSMCRGFIPENEETTTIAIGYFPYEAVTLNCTVTNYEQVFYLQEFEVAVLSTFGELLTYNLYT